MDSFGHYLIIGISFSTILVLGIVFIYSFYESFMKQKFRVAKLGVFLTLSFAIYINYFYVAHFEGEDLESLCIKNVKTSSANFLLSKEFRNCILNEKFRDEIIEINTREWTERQNKIRDKWLSNFYEINQKFIGNVQYIGYDKFIIIGTKMPSTSDFEYVLIPPLIKVTLSDCSYDSGEKRYQFHCRKQLLENNTEKEGFWSIDASKFPKLDFLHFNNQNETYNFYLMPLPPSNGSNFFYEHTLLGVEITKEHINRNIDSSIKSLERYFKDKGV